MPSTLGAVPTPDFILALRAKVGTMPLWLAGCTAAVVRETDAGEEWLLVRRADNGAWSPVSGIVDPGEHPSDAAVREVLEEAAISAEVERLVAVTVSHPITYDNGDVTQYIDHVFRCRWVDGDPFPADGENTEARFFPAHELPDLEPWDAARMRVALEDAPECRLGPLP